MVAADAISALEEAVAPRKNISCANDNGHLVAVFEKGLDFLSKPLDDASVNAKASGRAKAFSTELDENPSQGAESRDLCADLETRKALTEAEPASLRIFATDFLSSLTKTWSSKQLSW